MIPKIYAKSAPPWENGGSTIDQFESGLVRVTQEYLCPTDQRDTIAAGFVLGAELVSLASPATDGLFIYPTPQAADMNNGFSKISVTAYGRIQGVTSIETTYRSVVVTALGQSYTFLAPSYRVQWVTRSGDLPVPPSYGNLLYKDPLYVFSNGQFAVSSFARQMSYSASPATGFGEMQEQVGNFEVTPKDLTLEEGTIESGGDVPIIDPPLPA